MKGQKEVNTSVIIISFVVSLVKIESCILWTEHISDPLVQGVSFRETTTDRYQIGDIF